MLTSPVVVLLAWAGSPRCARSAAASARGRAAAVALALLRSRAGSLVSDAMQYHGSNLAPTARYDELALARPRFAGRGPDAVHRLRRIRAVSAARPGRGRAGLRLPAAGARRLWRAATATPSISIASPPAALLAYPLIVTRRDPSASAARPPIGCCGRAPTTRCGARRRRRARRRSPISACQVDAAVTCSRVGRLARIAAAHVGAHARSRRPARARERRAWPEAAIPTGGIRIRGWCWRGRASCAPRSRRPAPACGMYGSRGS